MTGQKKSFQLRVDPKIYNALEKWSQDEYRSVNAHIEYLLRDALRKANRLHDENTRTASLTDDK